MSLTFRGKHADFLHDWTTVEIDLEGALASGKTIACLWKEIQALKKYPGIWSLLCRWTDDATKTLLQPEFERLCRIDGLTWVWNREENAYEFPNGSRAFSFGLKTQSQSAEERYGKIRGLPVSRIYVDQAEQLPLDIAKEMRFRLRPDIEAKLRGDQFPRQLTFSPNPPNKNHWLAADFPVSNNLPNRRLISLSLYDNQHNLDPAFITQAEQTYPKTHPKYRTMILGERGLNVTGEAVYDTVFSAPLHVRPLVVDPTQPLYEAITCGKHNPCWVAMQQPYSGGMLLLGGILGQGLFLEDFLPLVANARREWFGSLPDVRTCCAPSGSETTDRYTAVYLLRQAGYRPRAREDANSPDVRLAMIERLAAYQRKRGANGQESLGIDNNNARWLLASKEGVSEMAFMTEAFQGGYVWDDHPISVGSKQVRRAKADDWYEHPMTCVELLECNFAASRLTREDADARQRQMQHRLREGRRMLGGEMSWAN